METNLRIKQQQFNRAMKLYEEKKIYKFFGKFISVTNISFQIYLASLVLALDISLVMFTLSFISAYILADFINGLVHMYMDNNSNYESIAGPLIASFHLHHKNPRYKKNPILVIYFNESGSKIWLAIFLLFSIITVKYFSISSFIAYMLALFCIISSVAEVSHYLCHNSNTRLSILLRKMRILLAKKEHSRHHLEDNVNYAFLNGLTDPLINIIAKKLYSGYKNGTDTHFADYIGEGTKNRN